MNYIFNLFRPYPELRLLAACRGLEIVGHGKIWLVIDGFGRQTGRGETPVDALTQAIFTKSN